MATATAGFEDIESIDDLNDVDSGNKADGTILVYRSGSGNYEHEAKPSGGGGSTITPVSTEVFNGTLSSATQNTNATPSHDFTWNDSVEHADITHTDGDSVVEIDVAGEYEIHAEIVVTNGAANNRQTWAVYLDHQTAGDVTIREYLLASSVYIRDDNNTYDEGAAASGKRLVVAAGEKIVIRSKRLDAQTGAGLNYADQTQSRLFIDRITYTLS